MFRVIFTISYLIALASAKVFKPNFLDNDLVQDFSFESTFLTNFGEADNEKLWVLDLNDEGLDTLKLREGTEEDYKDFELYTAPLTTGYKDKQSTVKKDSSKPPENLQKKTDAKKSVTKEDIFKYLNKFALYSKIDSDNNSNESEDPSVSLQFKGPFTTLIVRLGVKQWHYFVAPPSTLPSWFYGLHDISQPDTTILPDEVKGKFYQKLLRLLQVLLRHPV